MRPPNLTFPKKVAGRFVLGNASCKDEDATQGDEKCKGNAIIDDDDNSDSEDSVIPPTRRFEIKSHFPLLRP
jgi:hypothetical protein